MSKTASKSENGSHELVVRVATVRDDMRRRRMATLVADRVGNDSALDFECWRWLSLSRCTNQIDGYELPTESDTTDGLWTKFEAFLDLPSTKVDQWERAVQEVNAPTKQNLAPPESVPEGEKKVPT